VEVVRASSASLPLGEKGMWIALSLCASADVDPEVSRVCETDAGLEGNEGTDAADSSFWNSRRFGDFPRDRTELRWTVFDGIDRSPASSPC
jgi:hypothetical protein